MKNNKQILGILFLLIVIVGFGIYKYNSGDDGLRTEENGQPSEVDQDRTTLDMKTWTWMKTLYNDGKMITPLSVGKFTITFNKNGTFSARTDCNGVGGEYSVINSQITFDKMMSTLMYCENSQESDFTKMLEQTGGFMFTSKGEMILLLKKDSGSMIFE